MYGWRAPKGELRNKVCIYVCIYVTSKSWEIENQKRLSVFVNVIKYY